MGVKEDPSDHKLLPPTLILSDTSEFPYSNNGGKGSTEISVSETLELGMKDLRWFMMGDDDTVFISDNLVRVSITILGIITQ